MSKMISVASGFQYSVNIGYDLNNDDKLKNFIPTKSALMLLKDILSSTALDATERARVLVLSLRHQLLTMRQSIRMRLPQSQIIAEIRSFQAFSEMFWSQILGLPELDRKFLL